MKPIPASRLLLWLILALPGLWILMRWIAAPDTFGFGHAIGLSGDWAAWLLMLTLAITPTRLVFQRRKWTNWLLLRRRDFGVASFAYAVGHTVIYLVDKAALDAVLGEVGLPDILTGWLALLIFTPLAATSNNLAVRALARTWKRLHRLAYPAAVLALLHWALAAFDPTTAYLHIGILAGIELVRIALQNRQRVT